MNVSTENAAEKSLQKVPEKKPVSVYSVKFTKVINNFAEEKLVPKQKTNKLAQKSFSKKVFSWRNAAAMAAILAIGVLHFAFQMSVIRTEVSENRPPIEVPPIKIEPLRAAPVEAAPVKVEAKKIKHALSPKTVPAIRQRQPEIAPAKPHLKKKEAVESRAARLRRAERILTGA